ncbi:Retrovirus-related Pol polyprotein from type-2 retrotransposable element R2DM [Diplonema papillatum]|nr:Retrovirus-related Pol polyprotein from type-2 retrotransposable element R2DM [Diplonema papillatum]KAJ9470564.1 Retrovirus-related Pol polyprotein from type-2 retrotransposable element R2DM [Diplonema papillatum]
MDIALSIEESLINGTPLHGIALDFAKCFDRVPQGLVLDLVEALGLHERVLAPLRHVYKYLRRRFKYPLGVGDEFKVTNGILQGCPISVVLINALLSVLSKALVSRARVSPKSFADDLYLLSRLAKLLQEGIEVTAIFGSLTGLALNEGKCASFSTSEKGPRLEVGGKAVKSVKTVKVLGVPLGTEGPVDNGRSDATVEAAARLEASPLKPRTKFRVMQTIAASAHYGAAYCANSAGGFANNSVLRTALSACLIPRSNRAKSPLATLTLVAKAHLCDPACASGYSSLRTAAKQYQKERFRLRMDALLVSGADASLKGPVGLISNLLREIRFLPAKRHSFELLSFEGATVPFSGKETLHFVREGLRLRAWRYLTTQRQGYSGIERGVDVRLLNRLWQNRATEDRLSFAIRKCIAGAVYSREWCNRKWGTDDGVCEFCDGGTPGTLLHYFWECPGPGGRWVNLRCRLDVAGVAAQNMPLCLSTRGIPPIGTPPVLVERVQKLIGTISIEMAQAQRNIATTRPWELASAAAGRYDVELARDSRELLTKQIGTRFAATLVYWLRNLRWVNTPPLPTTGVELALDFEAYTRSKLPGETFAEKGLQIGYLTRAINDLSFADTGASAFPGKWRQGVCSLRCLGAPAMPGFTHRPRFAAGRRTEAMLNGIVAVCSKDSWNDAKPVYPQDVAFAQWKLKFPIKVLAAAVGRAVARKKRARSVTRRRSPARRARPPARAPAAAPTPVPPLTVAEPQPAARLRSDLRPP